MKEIACASGVEHLMDYLEEVLPADVRSAIDRHVGGCAKCVAFLESYRATPRLMREATLTSIPGDVRASLKGFLRAQRKRPPSPG